MSTIKSSTEHLTLNADGAGKDIKFQANGVEKASIDSSGNFTSTSIDATKLSGALPAIDGSALTGTGKVLQVITDNFSTQLATTATRSSGTYTIFNISFTPVSATSKLYIDGVIYHNTSNNWNGGVSCEKVGGGNAGFINSVGSVSTSATANVLNFWNSDDGYGNGYSLAALPFNLVTSTGSTASTSIQVKLRGGTATNQTIYINRNSTTTSCSAISTLRITEMEA